jgi:hypothetical protein
VQHGHQPKAGEGTAGKPPFPTTGTGVKPAHVDDEDFLKHRPAYPDDNPKTIYGVKKPPVSAIPPSAIIHLGQAMAEGERKYGLVNWRDKAVSASVYYNAAFRHLLEWRDGANTDVDVDPVTGEDKGSGLNPLAHVMACCAIILDAECQGTLNDDRGIPGKVHELMQRLKKG